MTDRIVAILRPDPEWRGLLHAGRAFSGEASTRALPKLSSLVMAALRFAPLTLIVVMGQGPGVQTLLALAPVVFVFQHLASGSVQEQDRAAFARATSLIEDGFGPIRLTMEAGGLRFDARDATLSLVWSHVRRVVHDTDAIILVADPLSIPVPRAALPEGTPLGDVKPKLEAWRRASGGSAP
ncbi:MAG: hypothetical protein AAGI51_08780 [Pseudomonadota bacterium]